MKNEAERIQKEINKLGPEYAEDGIVRHILRKRLAQELSRNTMDKKQLATYKKAMIECARNDDPEKAHKHADTLLCNMLIELGHGEIVDIYHIVTKWYA